MYHKKEPLENKFPIIYFFNKGLLLAVVLCCFYARCSPSNETTQRSVHQEVDSNFIDPQKYLLLGSGKKSSAKPDTLSSQEISLLQEGDILLRKGYGNVSDFIADFLKEQYPVTHCGFLLRSPSDAWQVLHTVTNRTNDGLFLESLENYCQESQDSSLILVRIKSDSLHIHQVLQKARALLALDIPFDMAFDDSNSDQLYCIEMMRNVFLEVFEEDWLPLRKKQQQIDVLSMNNFFDSTRFEIIFNHFDHQE